MNKQPAHALKTLPERHLGGLPLLPPS
jgi:hypothetical protein